MKRIFATGAPSNWPMIRGKEISPVEVVSAFIRRIEEINPEGKLLLHIDLRQGI
jgi:Asp-tRNA(Asn)/Glu-tRNA(Gln) amidotransferase A subunit family amidase